MKKLITVIVLVAMATAAAAAQRTTVRTRLRPDPAATARNAAPAADATVALTDTAAQVISFSGFEKPLRSRRESFFATNSGTDTITDAAVTFTYTDAKGRMLHRRALRLARALKTPLPPGETRRCEIEAWDTQQTFHYRLSAPPPRAVEATPFDVSIRVDTVYIYSL